MAEMERTRIREKEAPALSSYELAIRQDREFAERQMMGRIVVKFADCPQTLTRQGRLRNYLGLTVKDTPLQDWIVFTHEVRTASGKHRHQGGLIIYVIDGAGYSVVERPARRLGEGRSAPPSPQGKRGRAPTFQRESQEARSLDGFHSRPDPGLRRLGDDAVGGLARVQSRRGESGPVTDGSA